VAEAKRLIPLPWQPESFSVIAYGGENASAAAMRTLYAPG